MSQYGQCAVQNSYFPPLCSPSRVPRGTLSANTPFSTYPCQRCTIASNWERADGEGAEERKKEGERSELKREAKSGGVTSDTNQGMAFGLVVHNNFVIRRKDEERWRVVLEDYLGDMRSVRHKEVSEDQVREELWILFNSFRLEHFAS